MTTLTAILKKYKGVRGSLITVLQEIQQAEGYLPRPVLERVSRELDIPPSEIFSVATFYSQFHMEKRGRHMVTLCRGTACHVKGGREIQKAVQQELGIGDGETTEDLRFTLEAVACLGACFLAPVIVVDGEYFGKLTPEKAADVLRRYK